MECVICLKLINNSYSLPCLHHFCKNCILQWCHKKDTCPKCRKFIFFLKPDPEFQELNFKFSFSSNSTLQNLPIQSSITDTNNFHPQTIKIRSIDFSKSTIDKIGLTLTTDHKNNVIVTQVDQKGLAALSGIKKKSILISINDIPCISHHQTIKIIDFSKIVKENIQFKIVLPPSSALSRICREINTLF